MARKLLQFDFPMQGPWGEDMSREFAGLAQAINQAPGLVWKIWTENKETGEGGGIYLFEDDASADAYVAEHTARLQSFGITNIRAKKFDVNVPLSKKNGGPVEVPAVVR